VYSVQNPFGVGIDYGRILILAMFDFICLQCDCNIISKAGKTEAVYSVQNSFVVAVDYGVWCYLFTM
jgi:hypothetical protein